MVGVLAQAGETGRVQDLPSEDVVRQAAGEGLSARSGEGELVVRFGHGRLLS